MADETTPNPGGDSPEKPKVNPTARKGLNLSKPADEEAPASPVRATSTPPAKPSEAGAPKPAAKKPVTLAKPRPAVAPAASKPKPIKPVEEASEGEKVSVPLLVVDILAVAACLTFAVLLFLESSNTKLDGAREVHAPVKTFNLANPGDS